MGKGLRDKVRRCGVKFLDKQHRIAYWKDGKVHYIKGDNLLEAYRDAVIEGIIPMESLIKAGDYGRSKNAS